VHGDSGTAKITRNSQGFKRLKNSTYFWFGTEAALRLEEGLFGEFFVHVQLLAIETGTQVTREKLNLNSRGK